MGFIYSDTFHFVTGAGIGPETSLTLDLGWIQALTTGLNITGTCSAAFILGAYGSGGIVGVVTILASLLASVARDRIAESWFEKKEGSAFQGLYSSSKPLLALGIVGIPVGLLFIGIAVFAT